MPPNRRHRVGFAELLLRDSGIYRLRVEAAEDLLDEGARLVDETGRTKIGGAKLLLAVQATRAVHIFESIIALCRIGRGVPASMLNRALLEDALDVHWVAANPGIAPERADEHERLLVLGERSMEQKYRRPGVPLTDEEEANLKALAARYRNFRAPWTLATDKERIDLIKASWDVVAAEHIDYVYEVIQRQNNALLHPSPLGYGLAMSPGRRQINRVGPDGRWRDALAHGVLGFYLVLRPLAKEFGFDKSEAERLFNYASCLSRTFADDELRTIPDDAACPCGSGRAIQQCHRS